MRDYKDEKPQAGLESFVLEFLRDRLIEIDTLSERISLEDLQDVEAIAHRWKGFSGPYGFQELERLSLLMEEAAKKSDLNLVKSLFRDIENYLLIKSKNIEE